MVTREKNRGLLYMRRSGDRQETSLQTQLEWGKREANKSGVCLDADVVDLEHAQREGLSSYKDIRLDDAISGNDLDLARSKPTYSRCRGR